MKNNLSAHKQSRSERLLFFGVFSTKISTLALTRGLKKCIYYSVFLYLKIDDIDFV